MIPHLHIPVIGISEKKQMKKVHQDYQEDLTLAIREIQLTGAESMILALTDLTILELAQDMYPRKDVLVKLLLE